MVRRPAALTLLAVLALAGCGGGPDRAADETPTSRPPFSSAPPPSPSPSSSPSPTTTTADGRNTDACADADCEVTVSEPVTIPFRGPEGHAELSVTEVGPDRVHYEVTAGDGRSSGSADGPGWGCYTVLGEDSSGNGCGPAAPAPSAAPGTVVLHLTTAPDGTATVRISSG
ncbi:hypothetical protein [Streptomyces sp. NPDC090994]|uniref:hypothetical protein n=1 Tax=Streptomyces sp. NPDC090994 TaxID=3365969 RepID=UPI003817F82E